MPNLLIFGDGYQANSKRIAKDFSLLTVNPIKMDKIGIEIVLKSL